MCDYHQKNISKFWGHKENNGFDKLQINNNNITIFNALSFSVCFVGFS